MSTETASTTYLVKLIRRQEVASATMAFWLDKPAGFSFTAGQFLELTLRNPPHTDADGDTRAFSIASSPHENSLMVATRLRDTAFKRSLQVLPLGTELQMGGPFGAFRLHNNVSRAAVLLAGGIGITPFRSMLLHAAHEGITRPIYLFYANRRPEDAAFFAELRDCQRRNPQFHLVACMTGLEMPQSDWPAVPGAIDGKLLTDHLRDAAAPVYYIAGPPTMVQAMHALLAQRGVDDDEIRYEEFAGY